MTDTILPDGSKLLPGERIFRMDFRPHVQTMALHPGPALSSRENRIARMAMKKVADALGIDTPASATDDVDLLRQTRPQRQAPNLTGNTDVTDLYSSDPVPDAANKDGAFCSIASLCRAAPGLDYGLASALVRNGTVKADSIIAGRAHFTAGASAKNALAKLKSLAPIRK